MVYSKAHDCSIGNPEKVLETIERRLKVFPFISIEEGKNYADVGIMSSPGSSEPLYDAMDLGYPLIWPSEDLTEIGNKKFIVGFLSKGIVLFKPIASIDPLHFEPSWSFRTYATIPSFGSLSELVMKLDVMGVPR